jgi:phosphatidylglycerophosphate synthase
VVHGQVARHPATTPAERRAAGRFLEQIVHKEQDGPVTRYVFRTVSVPLTRLLVRTPVTPNQISVLVALMGLIGVFFAAQRSHDSVILGAGLMLAANYLDGCDGEIARLKLETSRLGAWMDTVTDELSQLLFMAALGWHTYLVFGHPLWAWSIALGVACYAISIAGIYYMLVTVLGSANSQDYVARTEIRHAPDGTAQVVPCRPAATAATGRPPWLRALIGFAPQLIRRDFVNLGAFAFALARLNHVSYSLMVLGGALSAAIIVPSHLSLRRRQRQAAAHNAARRLAGPGT